MKNTISLEIRRKEVSKYFDNEEELLKYIENNYCGILCDINGDDEADIPDCQELINKQYLYILVNNEFDKNLSEISNNALLNIVKRVF